MVYEAAVYGGPLDGTVYAQPHPWLNIPELLSQPYEWAGSFEGEDHPTMIDYRVRRYRYGPNPVDGSPAWLEE